jgi:hypothetical protein
MGRSTPRILSPATAPSLAVVLWRRRCHLPSVVVVRCRLLAGRLLLHVGRSAPRILRRATSSITASSTGVLQAPRPPIVVAVRFDLPASGRTPCITATGLSGARRNSTCLAKAGTATDV